MASQLFPSFENAPAKSGVHLVTRQKRPAEPLTFEVPKYTADTPQEEQGSLGCVRGVAWAFGIQAALVIVVAGLWELFRLVR